MPRSIAVELPRSAYYTGDVIEGTVVVETTSEVSTRGLYVDFSGTEETKITRGSGEHSRTYKSSAVFVHWRLPLRGEGSLPAGNHRFPFGFQIPIQALPSYAGKHANVTYLLAARLDVPLWPDAVWTSEIFVFYDRPSVRTYAQPVRFRSGGQGPEVYVELDGDRFFARELIGCRITLLRTGDVRIRRVFTRLLGGDWARADGQEETTETHRYEVSVPRERIRVGVPFTFEIPIPADVPSSYHGTYSYHGYVLQVGLDIAWGFDIVAQTPIVIVR
jgi:Arrestin (or S-antigen), N-terminal domain